MGSQKGRIPDATYQHSAPELAMVPVVVDDVGDQFVEQARARQRGEQMFLRCSARFEMARDERVEEFIPAVEAANKRTDGIAAERTSSAMEMS